MRQHFLFFSNCIRVWLISTLTLGGAAWAADPETVDIPRLMAVQSKNYQKLSNGLSLDVGYLPIDSFNKGFIAGGSYVYNFSEFLSWEVLHAANSFNYETSVKSNLSALGLGINGQNSSWLDYVDYYATTNLIYTPIYTKNLLFSKDIIHGDISFLIGGGAAHFHFGGITQIISAGLILDYFLSARTSVHFDAREQLYFMSGAGGILSLDVGLNFQWGEAVNSAPPPPVKEQRRVDENPQ